MPGTIFRDLYIDYARSMPHRIAAIIKANGDATKY
jgi:hypothetical protein